MASEETQKKLDLSLDDLAKADGGGKSRKGGKGAGDIKSGGTASDDATQKKLDLSLDDLTKAGGGGKSRKGGGGKNGDGVFGRLGGHGSGKGGNKGGGKGGREGWRKNLQTYVDQTDQTQVTKLYATEVVRITATDIIVDSGGFRTGPTFTCISEALAAFAWNLKKIGDEWYLSDGKIRLIRFTDGLVIAGGALEVAAPAISPGPVRQVKGGAVQRFRPY